MIESALMRVETSAGLTFCMAFAAMACSGGSPSDADAGSGTPSGSISSGTLWQNEFETDTLEPGFERDGLCQSWSLGNETDVWLSEVRFENDGGYHHSNWLFVPDHLFEGEDGSWNCADRGYSELTAAVAGGVIYAQPTQSKQDVQRFPDNAAVLLPAGTKIIGGTHQFNTTAEPITTSIRMELVTIPAEDVDVRLNPFRLTYSDLDIPARSTSSFTGDSDLKAATGDEVDLDLYYVMPHYHALGSRFELSVLGGDHDGEVVYEDFDENTGHSFDTPFSLAGADGVRFTCEFENPRDVSVGWGIGDQEMCVMLAFARSDFLFDINVSADSKLTGEIDGVAVHEGPCAVTSIPAGINGRPY